MTIEEATKRVYDYRVHTDSEVESLVNEIYDDFENRNCETCKNCQKIKDNEVYCDYFASFFEYEVNNLKFGCARWDAEWIRG